MTESDRRMEDVQDILELALEKEHAARRFYEGQLNRAKVPVLQDLLTALMNEEAKHVKLVEKHLAELRLGRL